MWVLLANSCFVVTAISFGYGFYTEWKQSRADGPVAIVATLPFAVFAAIYLSIGISILSTSMPWWGGLIAFPVTSVVLGKLILMANGRRR